MAVDLDDVVETAVMLPDFGRDDDAALAEPVAVSRWQGTLLRAASVAAVLVMSMAAAVLSSDRGTITGPSSTVTTSTVVPSAVPFDPVHGVIAPGRWVVGKDIAPGQYIGIVDAQSRICEWSLQGTRSGDTRWQTRRGQRTDTTAVIDLTTEGEIFESHGCHWRPRG